MLSEWGNRIRALVPATPGQRDQSSMYSQWEQAFFTWKGKMTEIFGEDVFSDMGSAANIQAKPLSVDYAWQQRRTERSPAVYSNPLRYQPAMRDQRYEGPERLGFTSSYASTDELDQLLERFGFTSIDQRIQQNRYIIDLLEGLNWSLQNGGDIRYAANAIITEFYTENARIRENAERRSVVKEILCRISNSPRKMEEFSMIQALTREMREGYGKSPESVIDEMIRKSILSATQSNTIGELLKNVFHSDEVVVTKLHKRFLEGLGLDDAGRGLIEFSVEAIAASFKANANDLRKVVQNYMDQNSRKLSMDTKHILIAVRNLTGNFTHAVVDNLVQIITDPKSVESVNKYLAHAIADISKFDKIGNFTRDLKYMLGSDAKIPVEGLPLRLMIFLIQPDRESCNFKELLEYLPQDKASISWNKADYSPTWPRWLASRSTPRRSRYYY